MKTSSLLTLLATAPLLLSVSQAGTVTTNADTGPGSLRQLLADAVANETIDFDVSLNGSTITLATGMLAISGKTLSIDASSLTSGIRISGNHASSVISLSGNSIVSLKNLEIFAGRTTTNNGGGVYALQSVINLENCIIRDCYSKYDGGGIWGSSITGSMIRCKISGNRSDNFGGGILLIGVSSFNFSNCQVSGNFCPIGGGSYLSNTKASFTNCTVQGNSGRGIIAETASTITVKNCILWENRAGSTSNVPDMQILTTYSSFPESFPNSTATISNSLVEKASGSASFGAANTVQWGAGNLNGAIPANAPSFIAPVAASLSPVSSSDLRVFVGSPVLEAGDNSVVQQATDLAGKVRIQGTFVDLGAYEGGYASFAHSYPTLLPTADDNGNGNSNFTDYALGLDPANPTSTVTDSAYVASDGSQFVTFTHRTNAVDLTIEWETSTSLGVGSWQPLLPVNNYTLDSVLSISPERDRFTLRLIPLGPTRFYRQKFSSRN